MAACTAHHRRRPGSRQGVALVLILFFIVMLTVLVIAFLSFMSLNRLATASYSKSIQAQEIARGGLQDILSDLHSEIIAGSAVYSTNSSGTAYTNSYASAYIPTTNYTAEPARLGYAANLFTYNIPVQANPTDLPTTLVRVSRASQDGTLTDFYPPIFSSSNLYYSNLAGVNGGAILNRASSANSSTSSANGRYVSAARWNKTFLLAATTSTNTSWGAGWTIPTAFATNTPDWVYVTRTGSRVCQNSEISSLIPNNNVIYSPTITAGTNPPASPVVGRYAYVVYDEGALLDVNAAGFPAAATNIVSGSPPVGTSTNNNPAGITQMVLGKSYLAHADLTQIPGLGAAKGPALINSLINLRNASYGSTITTSGSTYLQAAFNYAQGGFLNFTTSGGVSDSPLVSRQDLINFFTQNDANFNTINAGVSVALPYLGTFSRTVSAPSWFPNSNASNGGVYNYASNAEVSTASPFSSSSPNPNRDLANVRFPSAGTVTHYYDNPAGTTPSATYTVNPGDPLLQTRFSLAKIAWLSQANPNGGSFSNSSTYAAPIQACFGLVWDYPGGVSTTTANGGNKCWNYVGSTLSSAGVFAGTSGSIPSGVTIETLDQVAAESVPREPNFFELLKAAILSGSLGLDPGSAGYVNGTITAGGYNPGGGGGGTTYQLGPSGLYCHTLGPLTTARAPAQVSDVQIMRIGANIIDQFGSSSYPTAIYFRYLTNGTELAFDPVVGSVSNPGLYGPVDMIYGDKNLPYLERMVSSWCTTAGNGVTGNTGGPTGTTGYTDYANVSAMACFYQPQIWNPHQMPDKTLSNVPQNFQIRAYGAAGSYWDQYGGKDAAWTAHANGGPTSTNSPITTYYSTAVNTETNSNGTLNFTDSNSGTYSSSLYANPYLLSADQITGITASSPGTNNMASDFTTGGTYPPYYNKNHFVAFCTGVSTGFYADQAGQGIADIEPSSPPAVTFVLGWLDGATLGTGNFHPYCFVTGTFTFDYMVINNGENNYVGSCLPDDVTPYPWYVADPRTSRFATSSNIFGGYVTSPSSNYVGKTLFSKSGSRDSSGCYLPDGTSFTKVPAFSASSTGGYPSDYAVNSSTASTAAGQTTTNYLYYADPDGVVRPGDGVFGATATGDGMPLFTSAGTGSTASGDTTNTTSAASGSNTTGNTFHGRRPIILNRPFRNVGELGYTFRDEPFKTLDFYSNTSADAALLDVFSITDEAQVANNQISAVVAGQVNLNNAQEQVIAALLSIGSKKDFDTTYNMLPASDAKNVATAIANQLNPATGANPLLNRAGLATQLGANPSTGVGAIRSGLSNNWDKDNKAYLEGPVRALADVTNTRTWNLMIDIIAQSGHLSPTATTLNNFVVEGEKRYWLHIAIDRYTGKIIDQQLEPAYE